MTNPQELYALDAIVHEDVFGRDTVKEPPGETKGVGTGKLQRFYDAEWGEQVPRYSSDPEDAEKVERRLEEDFGWSVEPEGEEDGVHLVRVFIREDEITSVAGRGDTYKEALCEAAVEAMSGPERGTE